MKKIEIRRHALKGTGAQKEMLSPEGVDQAFFVGESQMRGKGFTHIATSFYFRTAQTAVAMIEGAGDCAAMHHITLPALFTKRLDELSAYIKENGAAVKPEHALIKEESARMAGEFRAWLDTLPADAHVLAVGHSPLVEMLVYGLTSQVLEPLKECEGCAIDIHDGHPMLTEHFRF